MLTIHVAHAQAPEDRQARAVGGGLLGPGQYPRGRPVPTRRPLTSYAVDAYPRRAKLGAGSIVLKPIPSGATAVGAPAKIVGRVVEENPAGRGWVDAGVTECVWSELTRHAGPTPKNTISYPSFKKLLAHSSVDEAAIGELFFELDGNLDGFITEKESRCWRIEKTLPKTWQKGVPSKRSA